jgi:hypothetical protein
MHDRHAAILAPIEPWMRQTASIHFHRKFQGFRTRPANSVARAS